MDYDFTSFPKHNLQFDSIDDKLDFFEKKVRFRTFRYPLLDDISLMNSEKALNFEQTLKCTVIALKASIDKEYLPYKINHFNFQASELTSDLVSQLTMMDKDEGNYNRAKNYSEARTANFSLFWKQADTFIKDVEYEFDAEAKDRFLLLAETLRDVVDRHPSWEKPLEPYHGEYLKVSGSIGTHKGSVAILPMFPESAVVAMYDDTTRDLFAEFNPHDSAETYISDFFGTDGKYAKHYREFLDCRARYPQQNTLLFG